jgi:isoleucyl-tRNA synthetase
MTEAAKDAPKYPVFLPQTDFPLRAGLAQKEPEILAHWEKIGLSQKLMAHNAGATPFVLHDGPPYANGNLHIGHALNKVLKDLVNRTKRMSGHNVKYTPGWDCHGLPIEWKIEEQYRAKGLDKDKVPVLQFRDECRKFAEGWLDIQRSEFKRLGVDGDWGNPYATMTNHAEATIAGEMLKFLEQDSIYRGDRPVMWSVIEKTALAEAEVEYKDHKSTTVWIRFKVKSSPVAALTGASIIIWTTTPWTLPANQALAAGEDISYAVYEVKAIEVESKAVVGEKLVLAPALAESVKKQAKISDWTVLAEFTGAQLAGTICTHPLLGQGYDEDRPLLLGEFVTTDVGTGFVHMAPSHGEDDFKLCREHKIAPKPFVGPDGSYYDHVPLFAGKKILTPEGKDGDANGAVISAIAKAGGLLAKGSLTHSYPHSWRSKAPIIFRCTAQWFISMEKNDLRGKALKAIDETRWVPAQGRNRIYSMIEGRPDWCISRQRAWGVPIPLFVEKKSGQPLKDTEVNKRIVDHFAKEGSDAWYARPAQDFLGNKYNAEDFEQVFDVADVWFDSGSTHAYVLNGEQADLYLEGSDQHRGWFHSSLLESVGTRGRAPFKAVLTHGFVVDEKGYKMSKSVGNVVAPEDVIKEYGADILRLFIVSANYSEDVRMGPALIKQQAEQYRRLRNTLRYLLGALHGYSSAERLAVKDMPELERWVLHRLSEVSAVIEQSVADFDYNRYFRAVHDFCAADLSAFYFDIRKDALYCDAADSITRRATRTVMEQLVLCLTAWLAPILVFTAEEAWQEWRKISGGGEESVHLRNYPKVEAAWKNDELAARWDKLRVVRSVITGALEKAREAKVIGSSLQASPVVYGTDGAQLAILTELAITSGLTVGAGSAPADAFILPDVAGVAVVVAAASGTKCERCWKVLPEVGKSAAHPGLCIRCEAVVSKSPKSAAA